MIDRQQLEAFAAVIEYQSFERASVALNITRGAVSQRVKLLEQALSSILVLRERPVAPTNVGRVLLRHVTALRLLEREVFDSIPGHRQSNQRLAIGVDIDSLATWFEPILSKLMRDLSLYIEVISEDRNNTLGLLARGDAFGCVSPAAEAFDGFKAEHLGTMKYRCIASPDFAARHFANGLSIWSVLSAPAILFSRQDELHNYFLLSLFPAAIENYPRHCVPTSHALIAAVKASVGYALVPESQIADVLAAGELVDLSPAEGYDLNLYWHHWNIMPAIGSVITNSIMEEGRKKLAGKNGGTVIQWGLPNVVNSRQG